jgi:hypothetical protein
MKLARVNVIALAGAATVLPSVAHADPITLAVFGASFAASIGGAIVTAVITLALTSIGSLVLNKLFGPKQKQQDRQASVASLSIGERPREAIFGTAATGGSLADAFNYGGPDGTDWEVLVIVVADHHCDSLVGFYVNDVFVPWTEEVPVPGYNGQLVVYWFNGTEDQVLPPFVQTYGGWDTNSNLAGCATVVVGYHADGPNQSNPVWTGGRPNFLWVVKGKRCYIPRKDSTVEGGSGTHRWDDPTTWEWTDNPIDCRYNWMRGVFALDQVDDPGMLLVGRGLSAVEAPPERTIAAANICDELVPLKAGGSEKRYRFNGVIRADEEFIATEEMFAAACAGVIVQRQGGVEIEPGAAKTVVAEITDDDLVVGESVTFNRFKSDTQRINTVVPRYIEPSQKWADHAAPIRRNMADLIGDGGPREETLTLSGVTSGTQAQRCGEIKRRLSRLERSGGFTLGPRFAHIEDGDWIGWTSQRHLQGERVVFRITRYSLPSSWRNSITFEEISAECFDWNKTVDELADTSVAQQQTPPAASADPSGADWSVAAATIDGSGQPVLRVTGTVADPSVMAVIIEYRVDDGTPPEDATDWQASAPVTGDLSSVVQDIGNIAPATDYDVSIRFSFFEGGLSGRLILTTTSADSATVIDGQVPL